MRRREFITLAGASITWPFAAMAQQAGRTYRLGGVSVGPRSAPYWLVMFDELRRVGFIEGQNLTIDWRDYGQRVDLVSEFVTGLVKAHVDVIYVGGDTAIRAAQRATTTIPILGDYREYGWVGTGKLACPARRQHDGYQRPRVRT